jgi:hypothetical protein
MADKLLSAVNFPQLCRMPNATPVTVTGTRTDKDGVRGASRGAERSAQNVLERFVPSPTDAPKILCVNFHIFQNASGGGNYQPSDVGRLRSILGWVNDRFARPALPNHPPGPRVPILEDSRIRFKLNRVEFYQDPALHQLYDASVLQAAATARDPSILKQLNIYVIRVLDRGGGRALYPSTNMAMDSWVLYGLNYLPPSDANWANADWAFSMLLGHELGHCLDLGHTYDSDRGNCNYLVGDEFLSDIYGTPPQSTCPHDAGWNADLTVWPPWCTNNLMGGTRDSSWISRLQAGRMHRALTTLSVRRYVATGCDDCASCVAFTVRGSNHRSQGEPVKIGYDVVDLNETFGWNGTDFIAPFEGIYHFDVSFQKDVGGTEDDVYVAVRKNTTYIAQAWAGEGTIRGTGCVSFNVRLEAGDVVGTFANSEGGFKRSISNYTFSGHRICGCA